MTERVNKYNRLFLKVYINYAVMVILFAVILGTIFMQMMQKNTQENYRDTLMEQAKIIAKRLNEFIVNEAEYEESLSYMQILAEGVGAKEVWTIPNPKAVTPMSDDMANVDLNNVELSEEFIEVIEAAFNNKANSKATFSEIHGKMMLIIGVPVIGANGEVCGALLLNGFLENQYETVQSSMRLVFTSALLALVISFVIAIIFARQLTRPISKMRLTALELAEGKYETKTGIVRNDEIGDLAKTIDFLTDKLMENEKVRNNLEQMRLDFFANVSHELRTPITVVKAYTESLVDGVVTEDVKRQQYYEKMLSECKSMERLVGDLLTLSKMQNPDFVIETEPINLIQIFEELIRTVNTIGEEKNIHIEFTKGRDLCMMFGDYDRLRQMFLIILDNAVKFSPENATIYIRIMQTDKIIITIRDEGIGIMGEELSSIFEKFYKSKLRQNAKGSGLGLAIAKHIALKHGGDITVKSEIGVGTEFTFMFDYISDELIQQMRECGI